MNRFGLSRFSCQGLFSTRGALARKRLQTRLQPVQLRGPIKDIKNNCSCDIAHPPGAQRPGIIINPSTDMAWRPLGNKQRTVFFTERAVTWINRYLALRND